MKIARKGLGFFRLYETSYAFDFFGASVEFDAALSDVGWSAVIWAHHLVGLALRSSDWLVLSPPHQDEGWHLHQPTRRSAVVSRIGDVADKSANVAHAASPSLTEGP
jgi:hypothetical protein